MADLGSTRTVHADFKAGGVETDPGTVTLTVTAPDGTVTMPTPDHDGAGRYSHDLLLDQVGIWTYTFAGSGAVPAMATSTITVAGKSSEGPCDNWLEWAELGQYLSTVPDAPAAVQDAVLAAATRTLWERSCRQFGACTIARARVTTACRHAYSWRAGIGYYPTGRSCSCGAYPFIDLGSAPVSSVDEVWIDGVLLDPSAYRVDDWRRLVRTDGQPWPYSSASVAAQHTVEVTWTYGLPIPVEGKLACALLVEALANEVTGGDCEVPAWATQLVREGTTVKIEPPDPTKATTTVPFVERWLGNFQCGGGRIFDPGAKRATTRVGT